MENLLESNERTLVMFDSVCSGLSGCLALVHADIKQMTEHRNNLAQLDKEHIQAKLIAAQELVVVNGNNSSDNSNNINLKRKKQSGIIREISDNKDEDPHHLAGLKLLDKRLADSFSQALSMNDLQKSSIAAKRQASQIRPSIFQVLLGKSNKYNNEIHSNKKSGKNTNENETRVDNKMIIDDINRQTRLAMQYSKQLEAHLFKVEDLRAKYEMHLKMGLVVKSVARAYLANGSSNLHSSIARHQHCSSLVINDCSSIGTHSSLSSLNLSTWSSSRSKADIRQAAAANGSNNSNQMFVSTISLNNKHNKRLNLAKLISSSSTGKNQQEKAQAQYADPRLINKNSSNDRPSHSMEQPSCMSNCVYADWTISESAHANLNCKDSLSNSNVNLNARRSSLKGNNKTKNQQAASSRTTIKEFIENIDKIEAEFESFMGSFLLAIEDIQGFARVCLGDVFEISIKYGDTQKFKTKISVLKDNRQKCDNRQAVFKTRIADVLAIKAYECKGLGKRVLLGHKLCETRDLFTARSQLMTISLNQTGSIKLNLIVTWNPLHLAPNSSSAVPGVDLSHISLPPTPVSSSTLSSLSSVPSLNGTTTTINIQSQQHRTKLNNSLSANNRQQQHELYQTVDSAYGYYIPPPDYLSNELKYQDS